MPESTNAKYVGPHLAQHQRNWKHLLATQRSNATRENYTRHIKDFLKHHHDRCHYTQHDIATYFRKFAKSNESRAKMKMRFNAIKFLIL